MYKLFYYIHLQFGIYSIKWYNNLYSYSKEDNYEKTKQITYIVIFDFNIDISN